LCKIVFDIIGNYGAKLLRINGKMSK